MKHLATPLPGTYAVYFSSPVEEHEYWKNEPVLVWAVNKYGGVVGLVWDQEVEGLVEAPEAFSYSNMPEYSRAFAGYSIGPCWSPYDTRPGHGGIPKEGRG